MNEFSHLKAAWHIDRIADLRAGRDAVPTHVQIVLSDLCNQNCFPAGTLIECPDGLRPIEQLCVGDIVVGPDGRAVPISAVGSRWAEEVFEIKVGGRVIQATEEHPFLTADGWKEAKRLRSGRDSAVVRVRLREKSEVEPTQKEMGPLYLRAWADAEINRLCGMEGYDARQNSGGTGAEVLMRMWAGSEATYARSRAFLGELLERPRHARQDGDALCGAFGETSAWHAHEKSNVLPGNRRALAPKPEASGIPHESRVAVLEMDEGERSAHQFSRDRETLDQSPQPGFQGDWTEESDRDIHYWNFQWWLNREADGGDLRSEGGAALHDERLGMSGDILFSGLSAQTASASTACSDKLLLEGIELERGLELRQIDCIRVISGRVRVYNFSCPPIEAYEANGFAVHNCHFCSYRMDGGFSTEQFADAEGNRNPNRRIPSAKALEILDDCAALGVKAIEFTGGGEPTVHPDCMEIIRYAQKLGLETGLVTNGVRLKPHEAIENLTWMRISLDAGSEATYERMRESKAWPIVMRSLNYAGSLKGPYVGVGFVVTRENYGELVQACEIAKAAGIAYVRVSAMFSEGGADYYRGLLDDIQDQRDNAKALESDSFKIVDFFDDRVNDLRAAKPDYQFCGEQQFVVYVGGNLKVYRCCTTSYTKHGEVGDLRNMRFSEWLATKRQFGFNARTCHTCQFNKTNRTLIYLLDPAPKHVNFV